MDFKDIINNISIGKLLLLIIIAAIAIAAFKLINKLTRKYEEQHAHGETTTLINVVSRIVSYGILITAGLLILENCGVDISGVAAGLGIASAVVALALQDFLKDVIMGLHIISDKFFSIGDGVIYNGEEGIIRQFTMKTTKIELLKDGSLLSVCNRDITMVTRMSTMINLDIPLSYEDDPRRIHELMRHTADKIGMVEGVTRCVFRGTQDFADSAVIYRISLFCPIEKRFDLRRAALRIIQDELHDAELSIPYNRLDIQLTRKV